MNPMSPDDEREVIHSDETYRALMTELKSLSTFAAVTDWAVRARTELETVVSVIRQLEAELSARKQTLEDAQHARAEKSMIGQMLSSDRAGKGVRRGVAQYEQVIRSLRAIATELQDRIDMSADTPEEQKALLKELSITHKFGLLFNNQRPRCGQVLKPLPAAPQNRDARFTIGLAT